MTYEMVLYVRVVDPAALLAAAKAKAEADGIDSVEIEEALMFDGAPYPPACIRMLLDPGESPPGCEILDSVCEP